MIWLLPWEERNDTRHFHWAVYTLLLVNVAIFAAAWFGDRAEAAQWYGDYSLAPTTARWFQFVTANFLHANVWHLLGNMLFLWLFGDNVEDMLGPLGFLLLYFAGGLAGDLMFVLSNPALAVPSIGASGCIATIAGAYAVLFAKRPASVRVIFIVFPIAKLELPAFWLLLLWFAADVAQTVWNRGALGVSSGSYVNFVAHGAGFALGFSVALWARFHGVVRRYETMTDGDALFGYWPRRIEDEFRRETRQLARRKATRSPASSRPPDRKWRG